MYADQRPYGNFAAVREHCKEPPPCINNSHHDFLLIGFSWSVGYDLGVPFWENGAILYFMWLDDLEVHSKPGLCPAYGRIVDESSMRYIKAR